MDLKHGNQSSEQHLIAETNVIFSGGLQPFTGRKSNVETLLEDPDQVENSRISNTASSLTSDSTCHEFIQVDSKFSPAHHGSVPMQKSREDREVDVSTEALSQLEDYFGSSSSSTACISDVTHESVITSALPTERPSIQVMERTGGFDPNRIPASVFANPTTVADWSLASNESLFSIQIGRGSFSRDHSVILDHSEEFSIPEGPYFSKEFNQSAEFVKFDKLYQSKEAKEPNKLQICRETIGEENEEKSHNFDLDNVQILEEPIPNTHYRSINDNSKIKIEGFGCGNVNHTPLKKKNSSKSLCSNSCCPSCDCCCTSSRSCSQGPDCSCKCLRCPTCSCSSCSCKCLSCPTCSCSSCSGCSPKNLCCQDCCVKCPSLSSCSCKFSSWECCKCRSTAWSLKKIFCCLSSKRFASSGYHYTIMFIVYGFYIISPFCSCAVVIQSISASRSIESVKFSATLDLPKYYINEFRKNGTNRLMSFLVMHSARQKLHQDQEGLQMQVRRPGLHAFLAVPVVHAADPYHAPVEIPKGQNQDRCILKLANPWPSSKEGTKVS